MDNEYLTICIKIRMIDFKMYNTVIFYIEKKYYIKILYSHFHLLRFARNKACDSSCLVTFA